MQPIDSYTTRSNLTHSIIDLLLRFSEEHEARVMAQELNVEDSI